MKAINRAIDRFCAKHRRFGIPKLMQYIVFISAAIYIIHLMDQTGTLLTLLAFHPSRIMRGEIWRLITWIFLPINSNIFFTALTLYFYYFIGATLEREWGTPKFTVYYLFGVILNIIYGFVVWFIHSGSMYAQLLDLLWFAYIFLTPGFLNLSLFFAFAALFPDYRILVFFIIPMKMKWLALIDAAFFVYSIISGIIAQQYAMAFLPLVALLNFFVICGGDVINYIRPYKSRVSSQTINFNKAARQARREYDDKQYHHKCAVCGKTDAEYPNLEFRYCSRCEGYHCFCEEHINNHIHFQKDN